MVTVTDALSNTTSYAYEPFGNLKQVTDAAGNVTTYTYDTRGRKIAANDPDLGAWTYTYNVLDQLQTQTDAARARSPPSATTCWAVPRSASSRT